MVQKANTVFRDFVTDGIPSSGENDPDKVEIRKWGTYVENGLMGATAGATIYDSKADMVADTSQAANAMAWVLGDPVVANNGIYQFDGTSTWTRLGDLPYSYIKATNGGAGTADAIEATTSVPIPAADGGALIALPIVADNTGAATVSFNGGAALTIKTSSGSDVSAAGLKADMIVAGYVSGTTFRLLTDQASAAIVTAAEAAADRAEAAAAGIDYLTVADRAALKAVDTTAHTSLYLREEGRAGQFVWDAADLSGAVTADTQEAIYIAPSSDTTGASGAWVRQFDGPLFFQWFGLVGDGTDETETVQAIVDLCTFLGDGTECHCDQKDADIGLSDTISIKAAIYVRGLGGTTMPSTQGSPGVTLTPRFTWLGGAGTMVDVKADDSGRIGGGGITGFCFDGASKAGQGVSVTQGYGFKLDRLFGRNFIGQFIQEIDTNHATNVAYKNEITNIQTDCGTDEGCYSMHGVYINSTYNEGNAGVTNCIIENVRSQLVKGDAVRLRGTDTNSISFIHAVPRVGALPANTAVSVDTWYYVQDRLYKVTTAGTTGALVDLPTFASGSDDYGTATLEYQGRMGAAIRNAQNTVKWATGQTVAIGDVRYYLRNVYVAASAGTTGSTAPTHTTGTVSDGGVSWTWSRQAFHSQKNLLLHLGRGNAVSHEGTVGNVVVFHNGEGGGSSIADDSTLAQLCIADHITGAFFRSWSYELDDELALPLNTAYIVTGTPELTTGGAGALHQHWAFDASTTETIAWEVDMPPRWEDGVITRMRVRCTSSSGNARLRFRVQPITTSNGYNITLGGSTVDVTVPVGPTFAYAELALVTPQAVTEACMLHIELSRLGTDALDTAAGDLLVHGSPLIRFNGNGPDGNPYLGPWAISPRKLSY